LLNLLIATLSIALSITPVAAASVAFLRNSSYIYTFGALENIFLADLDITPLV